MTMKKYTDEEIEQQVKTVNKLVGDHGEDSIANGELGSLVTELGVAVTPTLLLELIDSLDLGTVSAGMAGSIAIGITMIQAALIETGNEDALNEAVNYIIGDNNA